MTTLLKGLPVRKEDEARIKELNLSSNDVCFLLVVSNDSEDALAYCHQIEKFLNKVQLSFIEKIYDGTNGDEIIDMMKKPNMSVILARPLPIDFMNKARKELNYESDPDCLGVKSAGMIFLGEGLLPATAQSVIRILDFYGIDVLSKKVLVIGRSQSVGLPIALGLLKKNAEVTIVHSKISKEEIERKAADSDIIVLASGKKGLVNKDAFKKGQIVIDCGYHAEDNSGDLGFVPEDDFFESYTPVPGGVGPLTISTLIVNGLKKKGLMK